MRFGRNIISFSLSFLRESFLFTTYLFPLWWRTTLATLSVSFPGGLHGESLEEKKGEKKNNKLKKKKKRKEEEKTLKRFVCLMTP